MAEKLITSAVLPKTYAAIQAEFSDGALRREVWEAAKRGRVAGIGQRIALTAYGKASLHAVDEVLAAEWSEVGLDKVVVGEADPGVYGKGQVAAYLDQPLSH